MSAEWKFVPVTPTVEMDAEGESVREFGASAVYVAMVENAPQPPVLNECGACGGCEGSCRLDAESPPALGGELKCWSCKGEFTLEDRQKCDGCCWKCGVEIELDGYIAPLLADNERLKGDVAELQGAAWGHEGIAKALQAERDTLKARCEELESALKEVAASLAWNAHGECRAFHDGPIMPSNMATELAKSVIAQGAPAAKDGAQ